MNRKTAFTLIELLTVIAVISMLSAMLLPVFQKARQKAKYGRWQAYSHSLHSDPELVAYYDFEEGTGTTLNNKGLGFDIRGYDQETLNGDLDGHAPTWTTTNGRWPGKGALEFNGSSTYVDCKNDSSLNITGAITIEAWVKASTLQNADIYNWRAAAYLNSRNLALKNTGKIQYIVHTDIEGEANIHSNDLYSPGEWIYIVAVDDCSTSKLYINGVEQTDTDNSTCGLLTVSTQENTIGRLKSAGWFSGTIDEVAIYSSALSAEEIKAHYNMGKP